MLSRKPDGIVNECWPVESLIVFVVELVFSSKSAEALKLRPIRWPKFPSAPR